MSRSHSSLDTETLWLWETVFQNNQIGAAGMDLKALARKNSNSLAISTLKNVVQNLIFKNLACSTGWIFFLQPSFSYCLNKKKKAKVTL